ncbi:MAG TPA: aldo/keto reductase [Terrimesophilobacter sp.]|nr:aldo/keto reductase [Terrimesophilobacter sp.]
MSDPTSAVVTASIVTAPIAVSMRRPLGSTELRVSPIALGGNVFGWTVNDDDAIDILDRFVELGGNFIDTADSYAGGRSEHLIGTWLKRRGTRADLVIGTKIGKSADNSGLSERAMNNAVNASLERLGVDAIDLLYLHIDDSHVPFEETLLAADELVRAGKVRALGASDHSANRLIEARIIAEQLGLTPLAALQCRYNLMHRDQFEGNVARVAHVHGLAVMPRFALDGGFLTGKYRSRTDTGEISRTGFDSRVVDRNTHFDRKGMRVLAALDKIAAEQAVRPASVALAWLLTKPDVVAPVTSASRVSHVDPLIQAGHVTLTRAQVALLDDITD